MGQFITETFQHPILAEWFDAVFGNLATCSSAFNPVIYGVMNKKVRNSMMAVLPGFLARMGEGDKVTPGSDVTEKGSSDT